MKKTITLTEKEFQKKINEFVRQILNESFQVPYLVQKWEIATSKLGVDTMNSMAYCYLRDNDTLRDFLEELSDDFELDLFSDDLQDNEEED